MIDKKLFAQPKEYIWLEYERISRFSEFFVYCWFLLILASLFAEAFVTRLATILWIATVLWSIPALATFAKRVKYLKTIRAKILACSKK